MGKIRLTLACWDYDRTRALQDGRVEVEGIDLTYLPLRVEETFWRMLRYGEFDAAEMSTGSYFMSRDKGAPKLIAIPVFPSKTFRHSCIYINTDSGIRKPADMAGKRVGVPDHHGYLGARHPAARICSSSGKDEMVYRRRRTSRSRG
jgi:4,5-dihydroxyphthalate decarboxylase